MNIFVAQKDAKGGWGTNKRERERESRLWIYKERRKAGAVTVEGIPYANMYANEAVRTPSDASNTYTYNLGSIRFAIHRTEH